MNIQQVINIGLTIFVLYGSLKLASPNLDIFIDKASLFIVFGGTIVAVAIAFQLNRAFDFAKIYFYRILKGKKIRPKDVIEELIYIINARKNKSEIKSMIGSCKDPFIIDALKLIDDGILSRDEIIDLLNKRNDSQIQIYKEETFVMKSFAKYPPAFGMIGTVIGMIVLLSNLGGQDAMKMIGPSMSICLITTLYGGVLSNMIILPIADNLYQGSVDLFQKNEIIIEGMTYFLDEVNPILAAEKLNSNVKPSDRVDWKKIIKQ